MTLSILPVLPQFEQIGEACVHAGHAQYTQQPTGVVPAGRCGCVTQSHSGIPKRS